MTRKVIISCAVTGSVHTPSMSPYLPVTAEEIADAAVGAAEAGAAIVHLHARNPVDGRPDQSPDAFAPFLADIATRCDVIINITTGGSPFMSLDERLAPASKFQPELASFNMGSMNFGLFPLLKRFQNFRFDWEREVLESSKDFVFRNSFKRLFGKSAQGFRFGVKCDSRFGCGPKRAAAGLPISSARRSAIPVI